MSEVLSTAVKTKYSTDHVDTLDVSFSRVSKICKKKKKSWIMRSTKPLKCVSRQMKNVILTQAHVPPLSSLDTKGHMVLLACPC